jgi:hypothetical protein
MGGYQVLTEWLKDLKGSLRTCADSIHWFRSMTCIAETIVVHGRIDRTLTEGPLEAMQWAGRNVENRQDTE